MGEGNMDYEVDNVSKVVGRDCQAWKLHNKHVVDTKQWRKL